MATSSPRRAILITGFGSWGKSRHIKDLFGLKRFEHRKHTPRDTTINAQFLVESRSNDDVGHDDFIFNVSERYRRVSVADRKTDLIAAFCPSREDRNNALTVLASKPFERFDEIHVLLLQYKWDWHAELRLPEVKRFLKADPRVVFHVIDHDSAHRSDSDRLDARDQAIRAYLRKLYP
jgi:hypothetical protein